MSETEVTGEVQEEVIEEVKEEKSAINYAELIIPDDEGRLKASNLEQQMVLFRGYLQSGVLPDWYRSPHQILVASQILVELGLNPVGDLGQIAMINGSPCIFGELPLALCQRSPKFESIEEFFIDKDGKKIGFDEGNPLAVPYGAVCRLKRKGDPFIKEDIFSVADAIKAGLLPCSKPSKPWAKYEKVMLKRRARSMGLKDKFADCLKSIPIAEYEYNVLPDKGMIDVSGPNSRQVNQAEDLNKEFE